MMEGIIKKLGFDPLNIPKSILKEMEEKDDSPGPFTKLTYEEFDYLYPIMRAKFLAEN